MWSKRGWGGGGGGTTKIERTKAVLAQIPWKVTVTKPAFKVGPLSACQPKAI